MNTRLLFHVLLVGFLIQCVGCGNPGNPQQKLWDEFDAAGADHSKRIQILETILGENPDALHPDGSRPRVLLKLRKEMKGQADVLEAQQRALDSFDALGL